MIKPSFNTHYKSGKTDVLILGGGMAGVAAAHTLHKRGMTNIVLLEASRRLGGRVRETNFAGIQIGEYTFTSRD